MAALLALIAMLAGCAGGETANTQVEMKNYKFAPESLSVKKGATVTWVNRDQDKHTVTPLSPTAEFKDSGNLTVGQTFKTTFNTAGTFKYRCQPHSDQAGMSGMIGTITVTA